MRIFSNPASQIDDPPLRRAYELAERYRGRTSPNPLVGCVIVRDGVVVGEGFHTHAGAPHAEAMALAEAGIGAVGSTAYMTLEPCNHEGRTPPCATALVEAGVTEVVIGMPDPNPAVAGDGAETLRAAGVFVRFADDPTPFEILNEAWVKSVVQGVPFVQGKIALSIDGHAGLRPSERARLTGEAMVSLTMRLRDAADAVVVGAGTLRVDDPSLTVRDQHDSPEQRQPLRVVVCKTSLPSPDARIFTDGLGPALALVSDGIHVRVLDRVRSSGVTVRTYPSREGVHGVLRILGELDCVRVLVEPGPGLFGACWDAGIFDELLIAHAGGIAGSGAPHLGGFGAGSARDLPRTMRAMEAGVVGEDALTVWRPIPATSGTIGPTGASEDSDG